MNIYKYFFDHANDAIFIHDLKGNFLEVNETACQRLGYSKQELLEMKPQDIDSKTFANRYKERIDKLKMEKSIVFETEHITKEGTKIPVELSTSMVTYKGQKAILSVARDISQRKKAAKRIKESQKKYREAFKRAEFYKDIFAHDIGNLLQNIESSAGLLTDLMEECKITSKVQEVIEIIEDQITRGAHLIENIRSLSKIEKKENKFKNTELISLLKSAIKFLRSTFPKKEINIETHIPFEKTYIKANQLLEHVFQNILMNSVHHNENKIIKIEIKVSKVKQNLPNGNLIKIEFIDNGVGIPDPLKKEILRGKYQKRKESKGMGLGLMLVKKSLEMFDAKMKIKNRVKRDYTKGTSMILLFPEVK